MQPRSFSRARSGFPACRRAVLLAGGQGLRAWNPGLRESKLSLPLLGETVLEHQCRWLAEQGIRSLAVALCDDASEPLRHQREPTRVEGVELFWCREKLRQGTAGCLRSLRSFLRDEPFLILHQSVVPGELDLAPLLVDGFGDDELLRVLVEEGPGDHFHGVILEDGGAVRSFSREHPSDAQRWARCLEIYYAHPKLLDQLPEDGYWDLKEQLIPGLRENGFGVSCVRAASGLPLLDGPEDHLSALRWLLYSLPSGRGEKKILPGVWVRGEVEIAPSAHVVGPVLLEDGVVIQEGAHIIGPAYLAAGVSVGKSAIVRESALWKRSAVGEQASVYYSILAEEQRAMAGEELFATVRCEQDNRFGDGIALTGVPVGAKALTAGVRRGLAHRAAKRLLDIVGSAAGLTLTLPLFLAVAIAIRLDSPGPVFFTERRVGRCGRIFRMLKFRTMAIGASRHQERLRQRNHVDGPMFKMRTDPRVTRVGAFLRRNSIDELPQLLNVLIGHMSLVGPRPLKMEEMQYAPQWRDIRLSVRPGLTGLWQLQGRNSEMFGDWVRYDCEYVLSQDSVLKDLRIILETIWKLATRRLDGS